MEDNSFFEELNLIRLGDIGWVFPDTDLKIPSEDHEKALNLALNKISGEWDTPKLEELLTELDLSGFGIELTGFDELDIGDLNIELPSFTDEPTEIIEDDFEVEDDIEVTVSLGDIYKLGNHRLMCGDSTKSEDVSLLMNGEKADMVFTDPPYNVEYTGGMQFKKDGSVETNNREMIKIQMIIKTFMRMFLEYSHNLLMEHAMFGLQVLKQKMFINSQNNMGIFIL